MMWRLILHIYVLVILVTIRPLVTIHLLVATLTPVMPARPYPAPP